MVHLGPKEPPTRKDTTDQLQGALKARLEELTESFTVSREKLKSIVEHFAGELNKGLSKEGGNIPMIPTWVADYPTGKEVGTYMALDMGGTNLRVAEITLNGARGFDVVQSKYKMDEGLKTGQAHELFDFIAKCVGDFMEYYHPDSKENVAVGFTFSFPCTQPTLDSGILQRWTKGFDISGVEGENVVVLLQDALDARKVNVNVAALINDTTGTVVASNYVDPEMEMGCIYGTGCNAAYYEKISRIPKLEGKLPAGVTPDDYMVINCEYGAYDNEHVSLPRTKYDERLDNESPRPNQQAFEKMVSGYTMGELLRFILQELYEEGVVFKGQNVDKLYKDFIVNAEFVAKIELDPWENLSDTEVLFKETLGIETTMDERTFIRRVSELIGIRSARISMCGVAAMAKQRGISKCHAGADGSVFNKYPHFKTRSAQALAEIFDWEGTPDTYPIKVLPAEDGSGAGAAIIAALSKKRSQKA